MNGSLFTGDDSDDESDDDGRNRIDLTGMTMEAKEKFFEIQGQWKRIAAGLRQQRILLIQELEDLVDAKEVREKI